MKPAMEKDSLSDGDITTRTNSWIFKSKMGSVAIAILLTGGMSCKSYCDNDRQRADGDKSSGLFDDSGPNRDGDRASGDSGDIARCD